MKKISALLIVAALAGTFTACNGQGSKAEFKTDLDTLSYNIGMAQTQGLKDYLVGRLNVDTAYIEDFIKGLKDGAKASDDAQKNAYYAGIQIGQQVGGQMVKGINQEIFGSDSTKTINVANLMAGFIDGVKENYKVTTMEAAQDYMRTGIENMKAKVSEETYGENKKAGEAFIAEIAKKEGIQKLDCGVYYEVITEGKGDVPATTDRVKVNYVGTLIDGTEFDSSLKREEPTTFRADQVIKGWTEALTHMPVGSKWKVYIPQELAYGAREAGQIKPFSALIFEIELIEIEK